MAKKSSGFIFLKSLLRYLDKVLEVWYNNFINKLLK